MTFFSRILIAIYLLSGCQFNTEDHKTNDESSSSVQSNTESVYTPPPGYEASAVDPLAALYGGQVGKKQEIEVTEDRLKKDFEALRNIPFESPFPRRWRAAFKKLNRQLPTKVTQWSANLRTRMERGQRDKEVKVQFSMIGPRSKLRVIPYKIFKALPALQSFPKKLGDQHEHISKKDTQELRITYEGTVTSENKNDPIVLAEVSISWLKSTPSTTEEKPKNCRYVHALEAQLGASDVSWAAQHFKSTSTRRFVEWSVERTSEKSSWRGTWLYRNGSYRDKAVGWWVNKLTAKKAKQLSEEGMEQEWRLKSGLNIQWWPETAPGPMGCQIAGPLLSVEGTR